MPIKQISQIKLGGELYQIKDTTYAQATSDVLGLIKIGYTPAENSQKYAVELNNDGQAFVNVPWDSGVDTKYKTTLNGTLYGDANGIDLGTWFAPTTAGTAGQILSSANGAPTWIDFPAAGATLGGIKNGYISTSSNNFAVNVVTEDQYIGTAYVSIPEGAKNNIVSASTNPMIWSGAVLKSWMDDILGVDAAAVSELVNILSDNKTSTGILKAIAEKANAADIITYAAGGGLTENTSGTTTTFSVLNGYVHATDSNNFKIDYTSDGLYAIVTDASTTSKGLLSKEDKTKIDTGLVGRYTAQGEILEITWGAVPSVQTPEEQTGN